MESPRESYYSIPVFPPYSAEKKAKCVFVVRVVQVFYSYVVWCVCVCVVHKYHYG